MSSSPEVFDELNVNLQNKYINWNENTQKFGTQIHMETCNELIKEMKNMRQTFTEEMSGLKFELIRTQQKVQCLQELVAEIPNKINYDILISSSDPTTNSEPIIVLPINDLENFSEMERACEDPSFAKFLVRKLITSGGESVGKATRRVINKLFSAEMQKKMNFTGKNNKIKLCGTNFKQIILDAVKDIRSDFQESTAEDAMKVYLQRGQERYKNLERRSNK